jgi:hypothetical protein
MRAVGSKLSAREFRLYFGRKAHADRSLRLRLGLSNDSVTSRHGGRGGAMGPRQREEVLNVSLASCLGARGIVANPETITSKHKMPDVIATFRGLRCIIEGKIADVSGARDLVASDALRRVEQGIAHIAIGAVYPKLLRNTEFAQVGKALNSAVLDFIVFTEVGAGEWRSGGIDAILDELRRAHEAIVRDDVVTRAVEKLSLGMAAVANSMTQSNAVCDRLIDVLGIGEVEKADAPDTD